MRIIRRISALIIGIVFFISGLLKLMDPVGTGLIVDLHIEVDPEMTVRNAHDICEHVQKCLIKEGPNVLEVIVHVEP